jgi:hypothetical protein
MKFEDITLKNIRTLPLAGIAFHRVNSTECRLLESIDAEMISILNRDCGPDAVYREYENDTVIKIEYTNINGGIYEDIYLAERD